MSLEIRYAVHPKDVVSYDTARLREEFLVEKIFSAGEINLTYSMYDRYIVGGIMPAGKPVKLGVYDEIKADYFLQRREMGLINVGGTAKVVADGVEYTLEYKEALFLGMGVKNVVFESVDAENPAKLYVNSAPAHTSFPSRKISLAEANVLHMGSMESSNERQINQLLVKEIVPTCQLQMGMTELKPGSVWNTMPAHTHNRRMEAYFYFEVPNNQAICHFMGQPDETRHLWMKNEQAVLSPSWSIHSAAGTSNYIFIWGMAGENLDYTDMDIIQPNELK